VTLQFTSGTYLARIQRIHELPHLIDPTAPREEVFIDPETSIYTPPRRPEVFDALPPLPPSVQIQPLVNVQKQRYISRVVQSLVAGQHLAQRVEFEHNHRIYIRCMRLKALDRTKLNDILMKQDV
jgi:Gdp/GTP exchange factor required for growth at low temperatures